MKRLIILAAVLALVVALAATPASAQSPPVTPEWDNASETGQESWAHLYPETDNGRCVYNLGGGLDGSGVGHCQESILDGNLAPLGGV